VTLSKESFSSSDSLDYMGLLFLLQQAGSGVSVPQSPAVDEEFRLCGQLS
jgi:hypothetical protein